MPNYIKVSSYEKMCDKVFGSKLADENAVVYCTTEHAHNFFKVCRTKKSKFILVTGCSDFGIHYQNDDHPNKDLRKMVNRANWNEIENISDKYVNMKIMTTIEENCRVSDLYSVKVDSLTNNTFTQIPENVVRWYSTNVNIVHPKIVMIPFGVNDEGEGCNIVHNFRTPLSEKSDTLYINFTDYTLDRIYLKEKLKDFGFVNFRANKIPVSEFYKELSEHKFVLCPFGNGLDCYRIYETLIVGSIPIVKESVFARNLANFGFPVIIINDLFRIDEYVFNEIRSQVENKKFVFDEKMLLRMTEEFWKDEFNRAKVELL